MSLQVRTVKSNFIFYQTDGFGRDTYITYNNGGFWKDNAKLAFTKPKYSTTPLMNPQNALKTATTLKYRSDGSGRDSYILYNEGGFAHHYIPYNALHLQHYLRSNDNSPCYYRRRYLRRDECKAQSLLNKIQTNVVDRLYNQEKKKFLPSLKKNLLLTNYNSFFKGEKYNGIISPDNKNMRYRLGMMVKSNSTGNLGRNKGGNCYLSSSQDKINRLRFNNVKVLFEPLHQHS